MEGDLSDRAKRDSERVIKINTELDKKLKQLLKTLKECRSSCKTIIKDAKDVNKAIYE